MRGETKDQLIYFRHLFELICMSRDWENRHRVPLELYRAGKKQKKL